MAQSLFPTYQIVLIAVLGINVIFWLILLCWRVFCFGTMSNNFIRCRQALDTITNSHRNVNQFSNFTIRGAVMRINSDLPPSYEQAIKYPSLISISGQVNDHVNGHCNPVISHHYTSSSLEVTSELPSSLSPNQPSQSSHPSLSPAPAPSVPIPASSLSSSSSSTVSHSTKLRTSSIKKSSSFSDMESYKKFRKYLDNV